MSAKIYHCSFCGRPNSERMMVMIGIDNPDAVICDTCVETAMNQFLNQNRAYYPTAHTTRIELLVPAAPSPAQKGDEHE